jgi:regulator of cell morphogenesis and NO signaling
MMVLQHDQTGDEIKKIRKLSNEFTPPADPCDLYVARDGLSAFDRDMQEYIEFENAPLYSRARLL